MGLLSLIAQLSLDASGFRTGLKQSEGAVKGFSRSVNSTVKSALVGAFGVGAAIAATKSTVDYASSIQDMADRMGIGVEAAQGLSHAVKQTGAEQGDLEGAMKKTAVAQQAALGGNEEMLAAFQRLGVSADDLKGKRFDEVFLKISKSQEGALKSGKQMTDVISVMGKTAYKLLPAMRSGLAGAAGDAQKLGLVMSKETIGALDDFGDKMETLSLRFKVTFGSALVEIADKVFMLTDAVRVLGGMMGRLSVSGGTGGVMSGFKKAFDLRGRPEATQQERRKILDQMTGGGSGDTKPLTQRIKEAYDSSLKEIMDERTKQETARLLSRNSGINEDGDTALATRMRSGTAKVSTGGQLGYRTAGDAGLASLLTESRQQTRLQRTIAKRSEFPGSGGLDGIFS